MILNRDPANNVQTVFGGTSCVFGIKRSKEDENMEKYSASFTNCGDDADYDIYDYFGVKVINDGTLENLTDLSESKIKGIENYLNFSYTPSDQDSKVTINKQAMAEDDVLLDSVYFDVLVLGLKPLGSQDISEILLWRLDIE
jgi:hypothetical protein